MDRPSERRSHPIAGKYEVLEKLGDGATGTTYKVRHTLVDTVLSVTVLPATPTDDPGQLARVEDAVRQAFRLRHEHIVPVLDFGEEAEGYYLVEAFVDAEPLDRMLRERGPLAPAAALPAARQLADALAYAHERGVVHGTLAPGTVRVQLEAPPRAMLSGFVTAAPAALVPYSAPERLAGGAVDPRSDVFALGLLVFEMLEGKRFLTGSDEEVRSLLLHGDGPFLPQFSSIVPSGVSGLVGRALRRAPAHRQQSMAQARSEIEACLRRLGERSAGAKAPVSGDRPVRRHLVMVVDEALEEPAPPPAETADAPETRPRRRVAVKVEPATPEPRIPARAMRAPSPSRRRIPIAAMMLIGAVGLAGSWAVLRILAPAPGRVSHAASTPADPSPADAASAPPATRAALEPASTGPADDEEPPAAPAAVPDRIASAQAAAGAGDAIEKPRPARPAAPRIVSRWPRQRDAISVTEGAAVEFGVRAADQDPDGGLAYAWFMDGRSVGRRPTWRFVAPPAATATTHTVAVRVSSTAGWTAPRVWWTVGVTPRMREVDVRDWLDRLASAWERKDVATLRLYRIVTSDEEAETIRKRLPRGKNHHVAIGIEKLRTQAQYATVAFSLAEFDARGKLVSSARESYALEKQASGFVALRAAADSGARPASRATIVRAATSSAR